MCGIVGALTWDKTYSVTESNIVKMRDVMKHRGPDGAGVWVSKNSNIGLGHRRLAIVDLSTKAIQPMQTLDNRYVISFNGEIYNHVAIRKELESIKKYKWQTDHSDTEVVLNAFVEWGPECLQKFRGMFAIAIWDNAKEELFLARDRVGVKPLYYSIHNNRLVFASEIKALLEDERQEREINEEAFFHYLSFLTTPAPMTLFKGINKMPAATYMKISKTGEIEKKRYWDPLDNYHTIPSPKLCNECNYKGDKDSDTLYARKLLSELGDAVALRKMADVPVGCFLSGGVDSSTITALFNKENTNKNNGEACKVKTFSIGAKGNYNQYSHELGYAKQMSEYAETEHYEHNLTQKDMLDFLPELIRLQDEPIADPSTVPVYYLSKMAKENGVTVVQSGEGSDELFCGYPGWLMAWKLEKIGKLPIPKFVKLGALKAMEKLGWSHQFRHEYLRRNANNQPVFWGGAEAFSHAEKMQLLSPRLKSKFADFSSWEAIKPIWERYQAHKEYKKSILGWMSYLDLNFRLPELLLMRVDKMTMACGIEARVPFLDHKFVEASMAVPEEVTLRKGLKSILKRAVEGVIPHNLIYRRKQGLEMPLRDWFFSEYGEKARTDVLEFCEKTDLLDKEQVLKFFDSGRGPQAWYLLNVAMWWKTYIKK